MSAQPALDVRNLSVSFPMRGRDADGRRRRLLAVDDVSFSVARGKTLGIVGESGSGKTTAAMAVARLVPKMAGSIIIDGTDFGALNNEALRRARQRVQIIFQDPYSSLNPRLRAADIVREPLIYAGATSRTEQDRIIDELFEAVGLRPEQKALFPHQFSGGQRQRVALARTIVSKQPICLMDEPLSNLDAALRVGMRLEISEMHKRMQTSMIYVTNNRDLHQCNAHRLSQVEMGENSILLKML